MRNNEGEAWTPGRREACRRKTAGCPGEQETRPFRIRAWIRGGIGIHREGWASPNVCTRVIPEADRTDPVALRRPDLLTIAMHMCDAYVAPDTSGGRPRLGPILPRAPLSSHAPNPLSFLPLAPPPLRPSRPRGPERAPRRPPCPPPTATSSCERRASPPASARGRKSTRE